MVYAEQVGLFQSRFTGNWLTQNTKDVGFWLSYTIPTIVLCFTPFIMWWGRKRYTLTPPAGSVIPNAFRLLRLALSKAWSKNLRQTKENIKSTDFWQNVKPSRIAAQEGETPKWMTFDDREADWRHSWT